MSQYITVGHKGRYAVPTSGFADSFASMFSSNAVKNAAAAYAALSPADRAIVDAQAAKDAAAAAAAGRPAKSTGQKILDALNTTVNVLSAAGGAKATAYMQAPPSGMSTTTKVAIGAGAAALIYFLVNRGARRNPGKPRTSRRSLPRRRKKTGRRRGRR